MVPEVVGVTHIEYRCRSCKDWCLNHHTKSRTRYRECNQCYSVPVLDRGEPVDNLLAGLRWAAHALIVDAGILADLDSSPNHRKRDPAGGPPAMGGRRSPGRPPTPRAERRGHSSCGAYTPVFQFPTRPICHYSFANSTSEAEYVYVEIPLFPQY